MSNKYRIAERNMVPGFTMSMKSRPLVIAKLEEFFREKSVIVKSQRLIDELFVFIYNGIKAEAMVGYNDDLVLSFSIGLWVRETALRLRAEGIELSKQALSNINIPEPIKAPTGIKKDYWDWELGDEKEDLTWLIK